ncbi:MAG: type I restriction enzyme HsdR N-terminal domain-containing protein [Paraclostridium sp.]
MSKELVKDRVIRYLMEDLYVPEEMIDTDVALSEFEEGAEGVIDIMVNVKDSEDFYAPVMIIKCLDEETPLQGEVAQEAVDFLEDVDNITMAGRAILTNGNEMMYANWDGGEYSTEDDLPEYEVMVKEFFEMEEQVKEEEANHHECGCGHDHNEDHECCGGSCGCDHHHE